MKDQLTKLLQLQTLTFNISLNQPLFQLPKFRPFPQKVFLATVKAELLTRCHKQQHRSTHWMSELRN